MLCREIVAFWSGNRTVCINALCWRSTEFWVLRLVHVVNCWWVLNVWTVTSSPLRSGRVLKWLKAPSVLREQDT
jgi:hypothetical protein